MARLAGITSLRPTPRSCSPLNCDRWSGNYCAGPKRPVSPPICGPALRGAVLGATLWGSLPCGSHTSRLLHRLGCSLQKMARRALKRDGDQIHRWIKQVWPAINNSALTEGLVRFPLGPILEKCKDWEVRLLCCPLQLRLKSNAPGAPQTRFEPTQPKERASSKPLFPH